MRRIRPLALFFLIVTIGLLPPMVQKANAISVLDFEGLQDLEEIQDFYNGGTGSLGSGPGSNFGVVFSSNSLALTETHPMANFTNEPSPLTVAFFLTGSANTMNVAAGFDTGFSFFYSNTTFVGSVTVYDGLDGTGNILANLNLPALGACQGVDPFCNWAPVGVTFNGIAKSVDFAGSINQIGFDDITLGSDVPGTTPGPGPGGGPGPMAPIPEPSTLLLFGTGVLGLLGYATRRKRQEHPTA